MAFDTDGVLDELKTLLLTVTGVTNVQEGVPERVPNKKVVCWITLGGQPVTDKAGGLARRSARFFVWFGYRLDGAEATAERNLGAALDDFLGKAYAARKTRLNGKVENLVIDPSIADDPLYADTSGQEYRRYPVLLIAEQEANV